MHARVVSDVQSDVLRLRMFELQANGRFSWKTVKEVINWGRLGRQRNYPGKLTCCRSTQAELPVIVKCGMD